MSMFCLPLCTPLDQLVTQFRKSQHKEILYLSLFVADPVLKQMYIDAAEKHNQQILNDRFYDAGFDLFLPDHKETINGLVVFSSGYANKVDFQVKCCALLFDFTPKKYGSTPYEARYSPFYTYARSSISKTPLRLANNQGIIDAGYRGNIIGMFDCLGTNGYVSEPYVRLIQICAPNLAPVYVQVVDQIEDLGPPTNRGEGGIGSTGK